MMASAAEMITGGILLLLSGLLTGERIENMPGIRAVGALVYLIVFGSLIGFSSYVYLLGRVRPALATSYAYVNPIIAVGLGIVLAGERITGTEIMAMPVILAGVVLVILGNKKKRGL
jgi:drug/metabolite transporter (DMT)-like permease